MKFVNSPRATALHNKTPAQCVCGSARELRHCCGSTANIQALLRQAVAHHGANRLDEAMRLYDGILLLDPEHAEALHNTGLVAHQRGFPDRALALISRAIELNPDDPCFHHNLAVVLRELGRLPEAIRSEERAIDLQPEFLAAHVDLVAMLTQTGANSDAAERCKRAIELFPDAAGLRNNLGCALLLLGQIEAALDTFRQAIALQPADAAARGNLLSAYDNLLFTYAMKDQGAGFSAREYLEYARGWERVCLTDAERAVAAARRFRRAPSSAGRLRVGYVSGDFRQHAVAHFAEPLFAGHDRDAVEVFAYSTDRRHDSITSRLAAAVDHWRVLAGLDDEAARAAIEADQIDVLVDLAGHTSGNRLGIFARRAAPVQAHYLGYFATTGLSEMDYWIGDGVLIPPGAQENFSEQLWTLPRVWMAYGARHDAPTPQPRTDDGKVYVGSFNGLGKLTDATLALWAQVMRALPQAQLLLKAKELADERNRQRVRETLGSLGVAAARVELFDWSSTPDWTSHMDFYRRLDVGLDPIGGLGGATTTCECLWMGVPVVALVGDRVGSRMTASMLTAIGHPEWICDDHESYVRQAVKLASDREARRALRFGLRAEAAASPLFDARALARELEAAYRAMFERQATRCIALEGVV